MADFEHVFFAYWEPSRRIPLDKNMFKSAIAPLEQRF